MPRISRLAVKGHHDPGPGGAPGLGQGRQAGLRRLVGRAGGDPAGLGRQDEPVFASNRQGDGEVFVARVLEGFNFVEFDSRGRVRWIEQRFLVQQPRPQGEHRLAGGDGVVGTLQNLGGPSKSHARANQKGQKVVDLGLALPCVVGGRAIGECSQAGLALISGLGPGSALRLEISALAKEFRAGGDMLRAGFVGAASGGDVHPPF